MDDLDGTNTLSTFTDVEAIQLASCVAEAVSVALAGLPMHCQFDQATGIFTRRAVIPDGRVLH